MWFGAWDEGFVGCWGVNVAVAEGEVMVRLADWWRASYVCIVSGGRECA